MQEGTDLSSERERERERERPDPFSAHERSDPSSAHERWDSFSAHERSDPSSAQERWDSSFAHKRTDPSSTHAQFLQCFCPICNVSKEIVLRIIYILGGKNCKLALQTAKKKKLQETVHSALLLECFCLLYMF